MPGNDVRHYFSNSTQWDRWSSRWCNSCAHDHCMHDGTWLDNPSCPLILSMIVAQDEPELVGTGETLTCRRYVRCTCPD